MSIIMFSGYIGAGKSEAAKILNSLIYNSRIISFAGQIKEETAAFFKFPVELCYTQEGKATVLPIFNKSVRELILEYSAHMKELYGENIWIDLVIKKIKSNPGVVTWIIDDWRYPNEYTQLQMALPHHRFKTVRITRKDVKPLELTSEHALDDYIMGSTIENNGTVQELKDSLITNLILKSLVK